MNDSFSAPGRMDVAEQALASDPFFKEKLAESGTRQVVNRRGKKKTYSDLTCRLVYKLAEKRLDVARMRGDEIRGKAFELLAMEDKQELVA